MAKIKQDIDEQMNKKAVSFLKEFLKKLVSRKFQIVHFGWWPAGQTGKYGLTIYWNDRGEVEE